MPERAATLRHTAQPVRLFASALGGPFAWWGKALRIVRTARVALDPRETRRRLDALERAGLATVRPSRLQLLFGGLDMLRFLIAPAARDYYAQQQISFGFHQALRIADDPVSTIDPTGFFSDRDTIIGHVMQVVHMNPVYDLQLVQMFDGGLDEMERQVEAMVAGTHPRAATIGAIVEEPGYHARLLDYIRRYRRDPDTAPLERPVVTLVGEPHFVAARRTFTTLPGYLRYSAALPTGLCALCRRHRRTRRFPIATAAA
jgi:hypothetical protein